jgi:hypothetical protein
MRLIRPLQHWLGGSGPRLRVADIVPKTNSLRPWAETFPWAEMVEAIEKSVARRFPKRSSRGRRPVPTRVLLALALLQHAVGASEEALGERWCTDVAVMYAGGIADVQFGSPQAHFVLPETLAQFRSRLDHALIDALLAIQAAAAMDEGLVSPAPLLVDTFPAEQGRQRVTDATTLYKAPKKSAPSLTTSRPSAPPEPPHSRRKPRSCSTNGTRLGAALGANAVARAQSSSSWGATPKRSCWRSAVPLPRWRRKRGSTSSRPPICAPLPRSTCHAT